MKVGAAGFSESVVDVGSDGKQGIYFAWPNGGIS